MVNNPASHSPRVKRGQGPCKCSAGSSLLAPAASGSRDAGKGWGSKGHGDVEDGCNVGRTY